MARKDTYAFDSAPESVDSDFSPESGQPPELESDTPEGAEGKEGATLPLDLFGDKEPAVGDTITLKVTAIDPENAVLKAVLAGGGEKTGGIDDAAAAMDEKTV